LRILQLTGDWKWTGPAAPMLELLLALRRRGHEVWLACPPPPEGAGSSLAARARGAGAAPELELSRGRGIRPLRDAADARRLRALLEALRIDVVHTWHTRDHALALRAGAGLGRGGPALVRSQKSAEPIPATAWNRWLFGPGCDGLLCVAPGVAAKNAALRGGRPLCGAFGAVDPQRFRPDAPSETLRAELGLTGAERVVGIVARAQRHRRFDLLLEAMARLARRDASARLLVIGRGTHIEETARQPARRLGIAERVIFSGYRGEDYADALRLAQVFSLLVPGSDGGCRALLEAAACGIPAVTTRRGALPELVADGETGLFVDEDPEALARAWSSLFDDGALRARMGAAARQRALREFTPERFAESAEALYREALARRA
jgi:glycosyltransferase involved in cell wall biosynthesis